jgi:two-component system, chemotaxis family, sensor kinase CheA
MEVKAEYRAIFTEEAREHLEQWEQALLALERAPGDKELVHQLFRSVHTLKGSAGFIGFDGLQRLEHGLESALAEVREGNATLTPAIVDALFRGLDLSRRMVEGFAAGNLPQIDVDGFLAGLGSAAPAGAAAVPAAPAAAAAPTGAAGSAAAAPAAGSGGRRWVASVAITAPGRESYLRSFLVRSRVSSVARIVSEDPSPEVLKSTSGPFTYRITLETERDEAAVREAFNFDQVELKGLAVEGAEPAAAPAPAPREESVAAAPEQSAARAARAEEVVRVSVERLDTLLNLVGELVIQNSGFFTLTQAFRAAHPRDPHVIDLQEKTETLSKITRDLQDGIMKVRMLPVNNVFSRFHRVVRDLSKVRGKEVELQISGEETEIDKKVMDRIGDPLVHLVRNAVDHGLEGRDERIAAGKGPVGTVRLGAYQDGDHICVEVSDDGRGLDRDAILAKAIEKGLVRAEDAAGLPVEQIFGLIFLPGFSTAKQVTEVSGRGVGMDVVRREIEALGGSVRVRSERGRGTVVTLSLPLTMAIVSAVLVEVNGSTFAVPLSSVREVLKVDPASLHTVGGRRTIRLREEVLSLVSLGEALGLGAGKRAAVVDGKAVDERKPVIVVDYDARKIGLGVDRVVGTGEVVIKSLSRHYKEIEGLIGASILGNGSIALIVDVEALVRQYHRMEGGGRVTSTATVFSGAAVRPLAAAPAAAPSAPAPAAAAPVAPPPRPTPAVAPAAAAPAAPAPAPAVAAPTEPPAPAPTQLPVRSALLEEIHNTGAIQASMAIGQLVGDEVRVSFPESDVVRLSEVAEALGGEELPMGGIYVGLAGDLTGGVLLLLPPENMGRLHEMLVRKPAGSCKSLEDVDLSGIQELGNIVAASFINAMADATRMPLRADAPELSIDMCLAVIDSVLARFNQPGDRLLLTKAVVFYGNAEEVVCHLLLFLEPESLSRLMAALGGKA